MIERKIAIGDQDVPMKTSGALGVIYRNIFKSDLIVDMGKVESCAIKNKGTVKPELFYIIEQFAFACAKHANPKLTDMETWLSQFGLFDITNALPEIMKLWNEEVATLGTLKKRAEK